MHLSRLFRVGLFQFLVSCLLLSTLTPSGEAHLGPMIKIKFGHGHKHGGGYGPAASLLAAGIAVRLLHEMKHHGGFRGLSGGRGHGHSMAGALGGYGMDIAGNGMGYSFASHDAHLMNYGYQPQGYAWAK